MTARQFPVWHLHPPLSHQSPLSPQPPSQRRLWLQRRRPRRSLFLRRPRRSLFRSCGATVAPCGVDVLDVLANPQAEAQCLVGWCPQALAHSMRRGAGAHNQLGHGRWRSPFLPSWRRARGASPSCCGPSHSYAAWAEPAAYGSRTHDRHGAVSCQVRRCGRPKRASCRRAKGPWAGLHEARFAQVSVARQAESPPQALATATSARARRAASLHFNLHTCQGAQQSCAAAAAHCVAQWALRAARGQRVRLEGAVGRAAEVGGGGRRRGRPGRLGRGRLDLTLAPLVTCRLA